MAIEKVDHYCTKCKSFHKLERDVERKFCLSNHAMTCPKCNTKTAYPCTIGVSLTVVKDNNKRIKRIEDYISSKEGGLW